MFIDTDNTWHTIKPYVSIDEHGYQKLAENAPKDIEKKFWEYQADSADGLCITWVKKNIPEEYSYLIKNRFKFA